MPAWRPLVTIEVTKGRRLGICRDRPDGPCAAARTTTSCLDIALDSDHLVSF